MAADSGPGVLLTALPQSAAHRTVGKYQLFAVLGRGGMAEVFLALARGPQGFNKLVVVKQLHSNLSEDPGFIRMFLEEARLAARLNHSNVVDTYEVGEDRGTYFIAMEYLEGQALNTIQRRAFRQPELVLSAAASVRIVSDALAGLHYAHELRDYDGTPLEIIHRDISPHNIFVTYSGEVKLVDFGIAKATLNVVQTEAGVIKGKVSYMAPEQLMSAAGVDRRADVFAMGVVLWELLTRRRLMPGSLAVVVKDLLNMEMMPRVSSVVPDIAPALDDVVAKALARDPEDRFSTAAEMRRALEAWTATDEGNLVRPEELGGQISLMFDGVRQEAQRKISAHMASVAGGTEHVFGDSFPPGALGMGGVEGAEGSGNRPIGLLNLSTTHSGSGSGASRLSGASGSGAELLLDRSGSLPATGSLLPPPSPSRTWKVIAVVSLLIGGVSVLVGGLALMDRARGRGETEAPASASGSPSATPSGMPTGTMSATVMPPATGEPTASSRSVESPPASASASASATAQLAPRPHPVFNTPIRPVAPAPPRAAPPPPVTPAVVEPVGIGFLTLDSYPWARVTERGRVLGTTPILRLPLPAGDHVLTLENEEKGMKQTYTITIKAGETIARRLAFN